MRNPFDPEDLTPQPVGAARLEKHIQKACVDWARAQGWWARKFSSPANRSVPDYLFAKTIVARREKLAIEFKQFGKHSTKAQLEEQQAMRDAGWGVYQIDSVAAFKALFNLLG